MRITRINITNFQIYKGTNSICFDSTDEKNISIITGKNGYGKTTFLTSLVWAFYGRLMSQVEEKYRRDIKNYGGYEDYLISLVNREVKTSFDLDLSSEDLLSVEVELSDLLIPSIPCKKVEIKRTYRLSSKEESLNILIDGVENELTKDVGYDVFINDFILPREIAKFFFFDAEKIVSLAEAKTRDELRSLSKAYSEVLGIKKYEELKRSLEALLTKLRRNGVSGMDKSKLDLLIEKDKEVQTLIDLNNYKQDGIEKEIAEKRRLSDDFQEKLIREGNFITVEQLKTLKRERDELKDDSIRIKSKLNKLMELAPLVIAGKKLLALRDQIIKEQEEQNIVSDTDVLKKEISSYLKSTFKKLDKMSISPSKKAEIEKAFKESLKERYKNRESRVKTLVGFSQEQFLNFEAIYSSITGEYVNELNHIVQEERSNRVLLSGITKQIKEAEARKDNEVIKKYREEKESISERISALISQKEVLLEESGQLKVKQQTIRRELSEYEKNYTLAEADQKKYIVTESLIAKITDLIARVKEEKKYALQKSLKLGLTKLMHKDKFIQDVRINIADDIMDIDLIGANGEILSKDSLSKGEQQLYATALLKALVDESGIEFPVFIDSPLQKFDIQHSQNIIKEFYPSISGQVILLPLLEKELTEEEFKLLKNNLSKCFIIHNNDGISKINECNINTLFKEIKKGVYAD